MKKKRQSCGSKGEAEVAVGGVALGQPVLRRKVCTVGSVLIPLFILLVTQFMGIDFGTHWDEHVHYAAAQKTIQTGVFLPGWYNYPSIPYWLLMGATIPEMVRGYEDAKQKFKRLEDIAPAVCYKVNQQNIAEWAKGVNRNFGTLEHVLRVRGVFIVVTALAVIWVYLVVLVMGNGWVEALLAASLQAFSWEVAYHCRFVAPDGLMMQFGALTLLFCVMSLCTPGKRWTLIAAAVAAACATGSKYTAGLLVLPVLQATVTSLSGCMSRWRLAGFIGVLGLSFGGAYLFTTPATVLEPLAFWRFLSDIVNIGYSDGWQGYTIQAGVPHWGHIALWMSLQLFSHYKVIAFVLFLACAMGAISFWRRSRTLAMIFLAYPVLFAVFMGTQWAMIVRNLLIIAPFLAILSARGLVVVTQRLPRGWRRQAWVVAVVCAISVNACWLFYSAMTIRLRGTDYFIKQTHSYLQQHLDRKFFLTESIASQIKAMYVEVPGNVVADMRQAEYVCAYRQEVLGGEPWFPSHDPFMCSVCFGPMVVNVNYYSMWAAWGRDDHILVFRLEKLQALKRQEKELKALSNRRRLITGRSVEGF
jgi:hypothetical protein